MRAIIPISQKELKSLSQQASCKIVDIRDPWEFSEDNLGGENIPAHELSEHYSRLSKYEKIVVICSNGLRSSIMARVLLAKLPDSEVYFLPNGLY